MPPGPSVPGLRVVRTLERAGFEVARVHGSHYTMRQPGRGTTVPVHGRDLASGTLRGILADIGMTAAELQRLL
jgi:predicted RNA binding protein YcfA (HicA-like mRNA interferase family)